MCGRVEDSEQDRRDVFGRRWPARDWQRRDGDLKLDGGDGEGPLVGRELWDDVEIEARQDFADNELLKEIYRYRSTEDFAAIGMGIGGAVLECPRNTPAGRV